MAFTLPQIQSSERFAATSLAAAIVVSGRIFAGVGRFSRASERVRQILGIAVIAAVAAIALRLDTGILSRISYASTATFEQSVVNLLHANAAVDASSEAVTSATTLTAAESKQPFRSDSPAEGRVPSLDGAVAWLNSPPLTTQQLRGKVVLVDFWTYSCINCIRTLPNVSAWAEKYRDQGLIVIGVHAPEFAFEQRIDNVRQAIGDFKLTYPVAIDNNYRIWRGFGNSSWPASYLIDAQGRIRYHYFGEGNYPQSEQAIQDLLREAGSNISAAAPIVPDAKGAEANPDLANIHSGETYLGYAQATGFSSRESVFAGAARDYSVAALKLNTWGLSGNWTVGAEKAILNQPDGRITYRFSARDLHLVLGPGADGKPVRFQAVVDAKVPGPDHGVDIDADGNGTVTTTRLYQLVRQSGDVEERTFEIRLFDPGVEAYAFTFG